MNRKKIILSILLGIIAISAMIISDKLYKEKDKPELFTEQHLN